MFHKIDTKYLAITFFALLAIVIFTSIGGKDKRNRSFKSELTNIDTASVTSITIYPKAGGKLISFEKKAERWYVSGEDGLYNADMNQVKNMLDALSNLKAKQMAAKSKDKWRKYELTDSLGTRIQLKAAEVTLADLYIGKFSYSQAPQQMRNPYMQGQQGTMTSYVRLTDEDEVYAVDGFLSITFSRQAKDFRDNRVLQLQKDSLARISFAQPGKNYSLTKNDSIWMVSGLIADSAAVANYLSELNYQRGSDFLLKNNSPVGNPTHTIKFEDIRGEELVKVEAFYTDSTNIAISSSINPGTYFDGVKSGLFEKIFKDDTYFLKAE